MANPAIKIELGYDASAPGNVFTLDDVAKGVLNNTTYLLAGQSFFDVSSYAKSLNITRGKSRELDRFQAGQVSVVFNNQNRYFDPTFTSSPFYGQIIPRRSIRISVKGIVQFLGLVDDWNFDFSTDGNASATVNAYDALSALSQQTLTANTYPAELSGARVRRVLDAASVAYDTSLRQIDAGQSTLISETVDSQTGVVDYLGQIEVTENGVFFVDKLGNAVFQDSSHATGSDAIVSFSDDGIAIGYQGMAVVYGSESLYNLASITAKGSTAQVANNTSSQALYGIKAFTADTLHNSDDQAARLANYLVTLYSEPEFRFESVVVSMTEATDFEQSTILQLEIGAMCQITFMPNKVAPAITKYAKVLGIDHSADPEQHTVTLHFETVDFQLLILNDPVFGLLDSYYLGI
jgi:hypothetical protein